MCHKARVTSLIDFNRHAKGSDFLAPLNYYLGILENTDKAMLAYMSNEKTNSLLYTMQITFLLLLAEQQYEKDHGQYEHVKTYNGYLEQCTRLIDAINRKKENKESPEQSCLSDDYQGKYLFTYYAECFADKMVEFTERKTKTIKEAMGWFNEKRLYWVWSSSLLLSVFELIPKDFFNIQQATNTVMALGPYTGALSWSLYYFRFSLNLSLLLKHSIAGSWMSEEEKKLVWTERFARQWDQRKFDLLNDSLWATCNILCYFTLNSKNALGAWGDLLTLTLLAFDISMSLWNFKEQKAQYNKEVQEFEQQISILEKKIERINPLIEPNDEQLQYNMQLRHLENALKQCKHEWDFKQYSLINDIAYAVGLMIAFAILTTPFLAISGAVLVTIGAALCFAFTAIYKAIKSGMDGYKDFLNAQELKELCEEKKATLAKLLCEHPDSKDNEKKFLFLEIQQLIAKTDYQYKMVIHQTMHFFRSLIIELITPALIFSSFVFLPISSGLGILAIGLALAIGSHLLISTYKPKDEDKNKKLGVFDQEEYDSSCKDFKTSNHRFFKQNINSDNKCIIIELNQKDIKC